MNLRTLSGEAKVSIFVVVALLLIAATVVIDRLSGWSPGIAVGWWLAIFYQDLWPRAEGVKP